MSATKPQQVDVLPLAQHLEHTPHGDDLYGIHPIVGLMIYALQCSINGDATAAQSRHLLLDVHKLNVLHHKENAPG